ncbi:hypothetical protein [Nonomuraea sp. NPDC050643]|uniref:hypothetical protein n=1 Tax=Nonomuraea sp. NPDC050643 TaxID=3155660 RepID=UPI0033D17A82
MVVVSVVVLSGCGAFGNAGPASSEPPVSSTSPAPARSREPADVPQTTPLSTHFARVRAADPCDLVPHAPLKRYGPERLTVRGPGLAECRVLIGRPDSAGSVYAFKLDLHASFTGEDAGKERLGGRTIYREEDPADRDSHRSCHYRVPYKGVQGSALALDVLMTPPRGQETQEWPRRCAAAKEYLAEVAGRALELPARQGRAAGLLGKDPCGGEDELVHTVGGAYLLKEVRYAGPYRCELELENQAEGRRLTVSVGYALDARRHATAPGGGVESRQTTFDGLYTVRSTSGQGLTRSCGNAVELRPPSEGRHDAHYVSVRLSSAKLRPDDEGGEDGQESEDGGLRAPPVSCALADRLTAIVLDRVR